MEDTCWALGSVAESGNSRGLKETEIEKMSSIIYRSRTSESSVSSVLTLMVCYETFQQVGFPRGAVLKSRGYK